MLYFYALALIPVIIGFFLWLKNHNVSWPEWLGGSVAAFVTAGVFHLIAYNGMTGDIETWSGQITKARHRPSWVEYYEYAVYRTEYYTTTESYTDSKGHRRTRTVRKSRRVFDHWEPTTRHHGDFWDCNSNIDTSYDIDQTKFNYFVKKFGDVHPVPGKRHTSEHNSRMLKGDPNDYVSSNLTGWVEPITKLVSWENRIKAAPSVFSFIKVPTNIAVFPYPQNKDHWRSDRLLGSAKQDFSPFKFDQLNAILGPKKLVNLIVVGFTNSDEMISEYQRAAWIGGKKNDLVICYGPGWSKVFGWTDSELVKINLQEMFLKEKPSDALLEKIRQEVSDNYKIKDWSKFDYIAIEPRPVHFLWFFIIMAITQTGLYIWFHKNDHTKDDDGTSTRKPASKTFGRFSLDSRLRFR